MYSGNFDALLDAISNWPDLSKYSEKLQRIRTDIVERWRRIYDVNANEFNTLCHDDLWPPNILVKMNDAPDENVIENAVFIDFQFCFWSSPTIDLHFFLNTSVCDAFRPERFDELVEFYHQCLSDLLKRLNYKEHIPTWDEFRGQYHERKMLGLFNYVIFHSVAVMCVTSDIMFVFLAFITSCLEQPITIGNTVGAGIEDVLKNDANGMKIKRSFYENKKVQEILRKMIPYYNAIGTFD